ncbi:hypothetical protein, partial [Deinococcus sp.]|uniref:hypothetical protein n=1 Tax=Deinococcus sp. TaxID=47478 RepID=UPI0025D15281
LGNKAYFWYDLLNDGEDPANTEYNFGLLRSDFSPKASAVAMRTLIDTLSHNRFIRRIPIYDAPHVSFLLFGAPDGRSGVMILWNEAKTSVPFLMSVPGKANRISLMGNVRTLCSSPGLIALTASDEPQFVRFSGSVDQVKTIPSPVALPKQVIVASSEETTVVIKASNPLTRTIKGILTLSVPRGWRIKPSVFTLTIPVGGHKELPFTLKAPPKPLLRENLNFRFTASALPSELQASVALSCAVLIPRTATDPQRLGDSQNWRNPIISLGQANIISLYQNAPLDNMLFHGNNDLSARVFISRVPAGLRLSIHVHDDIFFQNEPAGAEWQGDSIQFAISPPTGENYAWTAALTAKGPVAELDIAPRGVALGQTALQLAIRRDEDAHETLYDLIVPARLPGGAPLGDRFLMTLLVNDNDGRGRKGWAEWTPGIGRSKDPTQYQPIEIR